VTVRGRPEVEAAARLKEGRRILAPGGLVEVDGQEEARLILLQWIDTGDERLRRLIVARQVPANDVVGHWQEPAVGTLGAFDARLFADPGHPFVRAGRRITGLACPPALEPPWVDVLPTSEERSEQRDLGLG